jgi:hypothetical protein
MGVSRGTIILVSEVFGSVRINGKKKTEIFE